MSKIMLLALTVVLTGCATTSDVQNIQAQIDELNTEVIQISASSDDAVHQCIDAVESANKSMIQMYITNITLDTITESMYQK